MDENRYYVYHWINDDTNSPFYVGKGSGNRYKTTKKNSRNPWFDNIITKHNCHPEIVLDNLTEEEAFQKEIELERKYRDLGYELCNLIPCGGSPPHFPAKRTAIMETIGPMNKRKKSATK